MKQSLQPRAGRALLAGRRLVDRGIAVMRKLIVLLAAAAIAAAPAFAAGGGAKGPKGKAPATAKRKLAAKIVPSGAPAIMAYAVTASGQIVSFTLDAPGKARPVKPFVGLEWQERIIGIDFRPSDKMLYAVTNRSRIYGIDLASGKATPTGRLTQTLVGKGAGADFNPVPDRLRIVNDEDQNLRANPADAVSVNDKALAYAKDDRHAGVDPQVAAAAYTNNMAGTKSTTLYVIDAARSVLATQNPPNDGVLNTVGGLGVDVSALAGFDIMTDADGTNHGYAVMQGGRLQRPKLYRIDLATGFATDIGPVLAAAPIAGLAITLP